MSIDQQPGNVTQLDAVVVGAGFAGLYALHVLRGRGYSARVFERGDGVGGTWYWNRYPGARCDVASLDYQYSFSDELQREWDWSERYAAQPEILAYANHVAERFDLKKDIQLETSVTAATFDDASGRWLVETDRGDRVSAKFCIMATGCLSASKLPEIPGIESFEGDWYHTGRWPHEGVDFSGQRVGIIGTGSSGVQSIPVIAEQADHLTVFQRTPNYSLPSNNGPLPKDELEEYRQNFAELKAIARNSPAGIPRPRAEQSVLEATEEERLEKFERGWNEGSFQLLGSYSDLVATEEANQHIAEFVRNKIRSVVANPEVAENLAPKDHPLGTKRLCIDTGYYQTYNRDNVTLVNIRETPIEEITAKGVRTSAGEHELDALVFATGFDAMTGALLAIDIRGKGGVSLRDEWEGGPKTYLGLNSAGFPNLFMITGPGSPSVLANMILAIEQHVDWIADAMDYMAERGIDRIEANADAQDAWVEHVNGLADKTLYPLANSWYLGANVPGKPRVFMPYVGGLDAYTRKCNDVKEQGYDGFTLSESKTAATV